MPLTKSLNRVAKACMVRPGSSTGLSGRDPGETFGLKKSDKTRDAHVAMIQRLSALQELLYADARFSLLIVLQGLDASGKDGATGKLLTGLNPQGVRVESFKRPTDEELRHDFLWRVHRVCPGRGQIVVFNRSHYEDVLAARVHRLVPRPVWRARYRQINEFERHLVENGTVIVKLFLNISNAEQRRRLEERLTDPNKNWKMEVGDIAERELWTANQRAYGDALQECSTTHAPWNVIPADHNWLRDLAIAKIVVDRLEALPLRFPSPSFDPKTLHVK